MLEPKVLLLAAIAWSVALSYLLVRARRAYLALPELAICAPQALPPDCMVVIPARNEEDVIGRAVRSLPKDTVIVVDDESTDETAREAQQAGAGVIRVRALPRGAVGKAYACMLGARAIRTKWILFADADSWYEEGLLESVIYAAEANHLAFVSVHLPLEAESLAEHILTPYVHALFFAGVNPRKMPEAAFYGHCVLARREAYEFIGGHGASLGFLLDDVKLALLALRHRMKIGLARTSALGHVRYQRSWLGLWEGIPRNAQRFAMLTGGQGLMALATAVLAAMWLPLAVLAYRGGRVSLAIGLGVLPALLWMPWYRTPLRALLAPLAAYVALPFLGRTLYFMLTSARLRWKGRQV
jgi:GT2 family glycosyltransferase